MKIKITIELLSRMCHSIFYNRISHQNISLTVRLVNFVCYCCDYYFQHKFYMFSINFHMQILLFLSLSLCIEGQMSRKKSRTCPQCSERFTRPENLMEHIQVAHTEKVKKILVPSLHRINIKGDKYAEAYRPSS